MSSLKLLPEGTKEKLLTALPSELLLEILESQSDPDQVILAITCTRFAHLFLNLHPHPVRHLLCQHDNVTGQMQQKQELPLTCSLLRRLPTFHGGPSAAWKFCRNDDCHKPWPTQRDWWVENMVTLSEIQDIVGWRRLKYKRSYIWWCIDNCMYPSHNHSISEIMISVYFGNIWLTTRNEQGVGARKRTWSVTRRVSSVQRVLVVGDAREFSII